MTDDQLRALAPMLDRLIPPSADGRLPGAGELGIAADVETTLRRVPAMHEMVIASLAALDRLAERRGTARFTALSPAAQQETLDELSCSTDAFPPFLMLYTFGCYYKHPRVLGHYGLPARPPHPQGYEIEPFDHSLLDPVRARGPIWRRG
jgi:hypothetical protein